MGEFNLPDLNASERSSRKCLDRLCRELPDKLSGPIEFICVYVVGSYGRMEAHASLSDFEWITVYDERLVAVEEARRFQADLTGYFADVFGRSALSINKTFGEICSIGDLCTNVGGEADTNRTLTFRMLVLAEGTPLLRNAAYEKILQGLAETYSGSFTAGHRLLSLATDLARYWRTLRIDYKHKVDEDRKPWAVRNLKLRSYRRFWFFSSAMHFLAFGPRINYAERQRFHVPDVVAFMQTMGGNPVQRFVTAARKLGIPECEFEKLLELYNSIHAQLGDPAVRHELAQLDGYQRFPNPVYESVRSKCSALHSHLAEFVLALPSEPRRQFLEMFLL
jgi:hypothetical protein